MLSLRQSTSDLSRLIDPYSCGCQMTVMISFSSVMFNSSITDWCCPTAYATGWCMFKTSRLVSANWISQENTMMLHSAITAWSAAYLAWLAGSALFNDHRVCWIWNLNRRPKAFQAGATLYTENSFQNGGFNFTASGAQNCGNNISAVKCVGVFRHCSRVFKKKT